MRKTIRFDQIIGYKDFVNDRDKALERILRNYKLKMTDLIDYAFTEAIRFIQSKYNSMLFDQFNKNKLRELNDEMERVFERVAREIAYNQLDLRRMAYMLAHAGESEAIAQTMSKRARFELSQSHVFEKGHGPLEDGSDMLKYIELQFSGIRRKLIHAVEYSLMFSEPVDEAIGRALLLLPKKRVFPKDKTALKKIKKAKVAEAAKPKFNGEDQPDPEGVTFDFGPKGGVRFSSFDWDNATWDEVVRQSNEGYALVDRSPATFFDATNPLNKQPIRDEIPEEDRIYGWELEQKMTHDFVKSVRDGQIDAANVNGIGEFIWIAILDQKTCDQCCEPRSGLLTSEIEKMLASDQDLRDHCDAIVPPAHFNCRCGIAPVAGDVSDFETPEFTKDFDAWLNGE